MATSIVTGVKGYPQFSPISTSTQLDDKTNYSLFGRLIPSDDGTAIPAVLFYTKRLGVSHLAVIHNNDGYGNAYARSLLRAAGQFAPEMRIQFIDITFETEAEDIKKAVRFLKSTEYRYFFGIIEGSRTYDSLMEEAYNQGIAGTDSLEPSRSIPLDRSVSTCLGERDHGCRSI